MLLRIFLYMFLCGCIFNCPWEYTQEWNCWVAWGPYVWHFEELSNWFLICISLLNNDIEHLFMLIGHLYMFLGEMSIQILCPSFNWVLHLFIVELQEFFIYCAYWFVILTLFFALSVFLHLFLWMWIIVFCHVLDLIQLYSHLLICAVTVTYITFLNA